MFFNESSLSSQQFISKIHLKIHLLYYKLHLCLNDFCFNDFIFQYCDFYS